MANIGRIIGNILGKKPVGLTSLSKVKIEPNVHFKGGSFVRPGKLSSKSVPTQEYIDKSFNIDFNRMEAVGKDGGFYDRKKVADALVGFTRNEKIQHVRVTSEKTADVINRMNNIDTVDALRKAEITGELSPQMVAKRQDMLAALDSCGPVSRTYAEALDYLNKPHFGKTLGKTVDFNKYLKLDFDKALKDIKHSKLELS